MKKNLFEKVLKQLLADGEIFEIKFPSKSGKGRPRIALVAAEHLKEAIALGGVVIAQ
jgi:hypothetical protein